MPLWPRYSRTVCEPAGVLAGMPRARLAPCCPGSSEIGSGKSCTNVHAIRSPSGAPTRWIASQSIRVGDTMPLHDAEPARPAVIVPLSQVQATAIRLPLCLAHEHVDDADQRPLILD